MGGWELFLVFAVALFAIGPKDLPVLARKLGSLVRMVNSMWQGLKDELDQQVKIETLHQNRRRAEKVDQLLETQRESANDR